MTEREQLEEIYEAIVGADGINRYTHDEIIDRIYDLYDVFESRAFKVAVDDYMRSKF